MPKMKKLLFTILLAGTVSAVAAQEPQDTTVGAAEAAGLTEQLEWLTAFEQVRIDGPMNVTFVKVSVDEAPRVVFDTKGSYTSKFKAAVNKNKVLEITERTESRRTTRTDVTVYYHSLEKIRIARATVSFSQPLDFPIADIEIASGAVVVGSVKMRDLRLDVSGKSRVSLSGEVPYLSLRVSSSKLDAAELVVRSAVIEASNSAEVNVRVDERLEAYPSGGAHIYYGGTPDIVRVSASMGGEVQPAKL